MTRVLAVKVYYFIAGYKPEHDFIGVVNALWASNKTCYKEIK